MDTATGGTLTVDGKDITAYDSRQLTGYRRDDIGFVFQFYNLIPNLTALENVELALQICKDPLDAKKVLEDVGLGDRLIIFRRSFPDTSSSVFLIARACEELRSCSFATSRQERLIIIRERQF